MVNSDKWFMLIIFLYVFPIDSILFSRIICYILGLIHLTWLIIGSLWYVLLYIMKLITILRTSSLIQLQYLTQRADK